VIGIGARSAGLYLLAIISLMLVSWAVAVAVTMLERYLAARNRPVDVREMKVNVTAFKLKVGRMFLEAFGVLVDTMRGL
jgi:hypothetical protein